MPLAATNFNELGLFTGVPQIENFSRLHELLPVRSMATSTAQRPSTVAPSSSICPKLLCSNNKNTMSNRY